MTALSPVDKVVLITGCSSGIGRDLAQRLTASGYTVVATARDVQSIESLVAALKLPLDVTCPESVRRAVDSSIQHFGRIDVLVNNAGYAQVGAIEELSDEQVQQMYDVNVFGALRMIRAVIPHMRKQNAGQIVNVSSIAAKMVTPVNGSYASTKHALEALSGALRLELAPFNIRVVLIEPGPIRTHFDQTVHDRGDEIITNQASPYHPLYRRYQQVSDGMRGQEPGPEAVSRVIQQVMASAKPKAVYLAGVGVKVRIVLYLRDLVWDSAVRRMFKVPDRER